MGKPLTTYKRIFVSYGVENKYTQMTYNALFSNMAKIHNLSFKVIKDEKILVNGLKVRVVDNLESLGDLRGMYQNQLLFYHVGTNGYEPSFESFFFDAVFFKIPSKKGFLQAILRAKDAKDRKVKFLDNLVLFNDQLDECLIEDAKTTLAFIEADGLTSSTMMDYLHGRLAMREGNLDVAFSYLKSAFTSGKPNPLVYTELQDFLYKTDQKDHALTICTKYVQKFPASEKITGRGIELSVLTNQFGNLDLFYKSAGVIKKATELYYTVYNAGLSVYVRYLMRSKAYSKVANYLELLAHSSRRQKHWKGMLAEVIGVLPLEFWVSVFSNRIEAIILDLYPEEGAILSDFVRLGPQAARGTAALALRKNPKMSTSLRSLIEQFDINTDRG